MNRIVLCVRLCDVHLLWSWIVTIVRTPADRIEKEWIAATGEKKWFFVQEKQLYRTQVGTGREEKGMMIIIKNSFVAAAAAIDNIRLFCLCSTEFHPFSRFFLSSASQITIIFASSVDNSCGVGHSVAVSSSYCLCYLVKSTPTLTISIGPYFIPFSVLLYSFCVFHVIIIFLHGLHLSSSLLGLLCAWRVPFPPRADSNEEHSSDDKNRNNNNNTFAIRSLNGYGIIKFKLANEREERAPLSAQRAFGEIVMKKKKKQFCCGFNSTSTETKPKWKKRFVLYLILFRKILIWLCDSFMCFWCWECEWRTNRFHENAKCHFYCIIFAWTICKRTSRNHQSLRKI